MAFADHHGVLLLQELVRSIVPLLPHCFYAHLSPGLSGVLGEHYTIESHGMHCKMALTDTSRLAGADASEVEALTEADAPELVRFFAASNPRASFEPSMLRIGHIYGIRGPEGLRSVAGVHVYSEQYRVAALANIATHPAHRRKGYAKAARLEDRRLPLAKKKTWREKLEDSKGLPKVITCGEKKGKHGPRWGLRPGDTLVIPAPAQVDETMRTVAEGELITTSEIRDLLAGRHGTTSACPMTVGIFAWVAAHAAEEARAEGQQDITPYWRTLKAGGELNPKYPGGIDRQKERLEATGHRVIRKAKRWVVEHTPPPPPDRAQ